MKKIVITGATSMLGTALTEVAVREGIEVYAVVRPGTTRADRIVSSPLVHLIYGSLENLSDIKDIPGDCDVLYHFAWAGTEKGSRDDPQIHEKNIKYTLETVELAERAGCRRFVYAGSQAEYGPVEELIDENTRYNPILSYGVAKYASGILSRKLCEKKGIDHIWGRVFSVYGPHDNDGTMLDYAIKCWERGETAKFSSATQYWNYLYETDAAEMFYRLGQEEVKPGTYFVANPKSEILRDYIETMMAVYRSSAKVEFADRSSAQALGLNVDAGRTVDALTFTPLVSFQEGIRKMVDAKTHVGGVQSKLIFMSSASSCEGRLAA